MKTRLTPLDKGVRWTQGVAMWGKKMQWLDGRGHIQMQHLDWVSQTRQPHKINEGITRPLELRTCKERQSERRNNNPAP